MVSPLFLCGFGGAQARLRLGNEESGKNPHLSIDKKIYLEYS
jgi:hypothetical protein